MISRLVTLVVLAYALGFVLFAVTLHGPAGPERTDAIVVVTGGSGRIERGMAMLRQRQAKRLLIAGADTSVGKEDLIRRIGGSERLIRCCVDIGSESVDTKSNAEEALRWMRRRGYTSLRLVTSDWHMRRARYEFRREMGRELRIVPDAVRTEPSFTGLLAEYTKYVLRRMAVGLEI